MATRCCLLIDMNRTTVILMFVMAVRPSICEWGTQTAICDPVPRVISHVVVVSLICVVFYVCHKSFSLRRALHREGQMELP